jgi:hypothetical protein
MATSQSSRGRMWNDTITLARASPRERRPAINLPSAAVAPPDSHGELDANQMPKHHTDPRIDAYIGALPEWQQAVCQQIRRLVHDADPEVVETIKRTRQPYFTLNGNVCALLAAKKWVNVFLYDGAIVPDPDGIITSGHHNKTARTVAIRQGENVNASALIAMFKQIIANNRAGGWRTLKPRR